MEKKNKLFIKNYHYKRAVKPCFQGEKLSCNRRENRNDYWNSLRDFSSKPILLGYQQSWCS